MNDPLLTIQLAIKARLSSDEWFKNLSVIAQDKGDIQNQIDIALGKIGAAVVILTPTADCNYPNQPGPYLDAITVVVACIENVTINRGATGSKKNAITTAQIVLALLHPPWTGTYLNDQTQQHEPLGILIPTRPTLRLEVDPDDPDLLVYHVSFLTHAGIDYTHVPL